MIRYSLVIILTIINSVFMLLNLISNSPQTKAQDIPDVLRGHALEIIDTGGQVRASITIEPPIIVDSKKYPETVLFRMRDADGPPRMKFAASKEGVGLDLVGENQVRVRIMSKNNSQIKLIDAGGNERVISP